MGIIWAILGGWLGASVVLGALWALVGARLRQAAPVPPVAVLIWQCPECGDIGVTRKEDLVPERYPCGCDR